MRVGFYLLSAGRLDLERSDLPLDFYLWLIHTGSDTPQFEFLNSRDARVVRQNTQEAGMPGLPGAQTTVFRVTGHFEQDLDMSRYPFENHEIKIAFEDSEADLTRRRYLIDGTGITRDAGFQIVGWNVDSCKVETATHSYSSNFGVVGAPLQEYAQVLVSMQISRPRGLMFLKTFVPVLLFVTIAMMGLFFPVDNLNQKVGLAVGGLFSSVAYHVNLTRNMPPVGYLTVVDRLLIGQYALLFLTLLTAIITFIACKAEFEREARLISTLGRLLIPTAAVVLYLLQLSDILF
ncbi:MAG TPA: hypothetical protein PKO06_18855 [Candidatus Ozemobacteraceae bacterium]|nr:hypothetical protein [Candidatus Ozemobacteraceae bacterium]